MENSNLPDMGIITASEISRSLLKLQQQLLTLGLIPSSGSTGISDAITELKSQGKNTLWSYSIGKSKPLSFTPTKSRKLDAEIVPKITIQIAVDDSLVEKAHFSFKTLNTAMELATLSNSKVIYRAHIDLSTLKGEGIYQPGPIFHFQFGGDKKTDVTTIRRPRWLFPPMDLVLMAELVTANFYPEKWGELRRQKGWIELIRFSQKLCYRPFFDIANSEMERSSLLDTFWADNWNEN